MFLPPVSHMQELAKLCPAPRISSAGLRSIRASGDNRFPVANMQANRRRLAAAILALALCGTTANAQISPPPVQQPDRNDPEISTEDTSTTFKVKVNLVEVRVVVRDAQGHAVGNLKQEDFQLLDNGKPQIISRFTVEKAGPKPPVIQQEGAPGNAATLDPADALYRLSLRRHPSAVSRAGTREGRGRAPSPEHADHGPGRHLHHLRPNPARLHR